SAPRKRTAFEPTSTAASRNGNTDSSAPSVCSTFFLANRCAAACRRSMGPGASLLIRYATFTPEARALLTVKVVTEDLVRAAPYDHVPEQLERCDGSGRRIMQVHGAVGENAEPFEALLPLAGDVLHTQLGALEPTQQPHACRRITHADVLPGEIDGEACGGIGCGKLRP